MTDDAKTGVDICIRVLNIIFANAVPKIDKIITKPNDGKNDEFEIVESLSAPEKTNTAKDGIIIAVKFATVIVKGRISFK